MSLAGPTTLIVLGAISTVLGATLFRQYESFDCATLSCPARRAFPEASKALLITGALAITAGVSWLPFRLKKRRAQAAALDRIDAQLRDAAAPLSVLPVVLPRTTGQSDFVGLVATVQL